MTTISKPRFKMGEVVIFNATGDPQHDKEAYVTEVIAGEPTRYKVRMRMRPGTIYIYVEVFEDELTWIAK